MASNETVAEVAKEFGDNIALMRKCKCVGVSLWNCLKFKLRLEVAHKRKVAELKAAYDKLVKELADALDKHIDCRCGCDKCSMPSCTNKANRALVTQARKPLEGGNDESK